MTAESLNELAPDAGPRSPDEQAIRDLMAREVAAFFARDAAGWAACYLQSDRVRSVMMSHDLGLDVRVGWDALCEGTRMHFESTVPHTSSYRKDIEQIEIIGDCAWLACRAYAESSMCLMDETYETWVLERHDGQWKVVCCDVLSSRSSRNRDRRLAVDAEGRLVGLDARTRAQFDKHPAFTIRAGHLRAIDPDIDRELQVAIGRAGALHGYFEQVSFALSEGQRFAYPIVLERPDTGGREVILITVEDRLTYLDFGKSEETASRVDVAAMVFGLSDSQQRIAQGIVAGQSLPDIAADLHISPATAKTHLQRVYSKTGTTTMTALVRTLLSVT